MAKVRYQELRRTTINTPSLLTIGRVSATINPSTRYCSPTSDWGDGPRDLWAYVEFVPVSTYSCRQLAKKQIWDQRGRHKCDLRGDSIRLHQDFQLWWASNKGNAAAGWGWCLRYPSFSLHQTGNDTSVSPRAESNAARNAAQAWPLPPDERRSRQGEGQAKKIAASAPRPIQFLICRITKYVTCRLCRRASERVHCIRPKKNAK